MRDATEYRAGIPLFEAPERDRVDLMAVMSDEQMNIASPTLAPDRGNWTIERRRRQPCVDRCANRHHYFFDGCHSSEFDDDRKRGYCRRGAVRLLTALGFALLDRWRLRLDRHDGVRHAATP